MFNKFFVLAGVGAVLSLGLTGCSTKPTTNEICLIEINALTSIIWLKQFLLVFSTRAMK